MLTATRVLNIVSGIIILVTGIYVEWRFADLMSVGTRLLVGLAAATYFLAQLNLRLDSRTPGAPGPGERV